jgi:hypothetical protein
MFSGGRGEVRKVDVWGRKWGCVVEAESGISLY